MSQDEHTDPHVLNPGQTPETLAPPEDYVTSDPNVLQIVRDQEAEDDMSRLTQYQLKIRYEKDPMTIACPIIITTRIKNKPTNTEDDTQEDDIDTTPSVLHCFNRAGKVTFGRSATKTDVCFDLDTPAQGVSGQAFTIDWQGHKCLEIVSTNTHQIIIKSKGQTKAINKEAKYELHDDDVITFPAFELLIKNVDYAVSQNNEAIQRKLKRDTLTTTMTAHLNTIQEAAATYVEILANIAKAPTLAQLLQLERQAPRPPINFQPPPTYHNGNNAQKTPHHNTENRDNNTKHDQNEHRPKKPRHEINEYRGPQVHNPPINAYVKNRDQNNFCFLHSDQTDADYYCPITSLIPGNHKTFPNIGQHVLIARTSKKRGQKNEMAHDVSIVH